MRYIECPAEWSGADSDVSVFLGGGITGCPDWQSEITRKLASCNLTLLNPRRKHWDANNESLGVEQIEWEHRHLLRAGAILFWFPCETLCPITLYELGSWTVRPKTLFIGCHPDYKRKRDVEIQTRLERPNQTISYSLEELAAKILDWVAKREPCNDKP